MYKNKIDCSNSLKIALAAEHNYIESVSTDIKRLHLTKFNQIDIDSIPNIDVILEFKKMDDVKYIAYNIHDSFFIRVNNSWLIYFNKNMYDNNIIKFIESQMNETFLITKFYIDDSFYYQCFNVKTVRIMLELICYINKDITFPNRFGNVHEIDTCNISIL